MTVESIQLIVRIEDQVVQHLPLTQDVATIGRTPDNTLSLPHPQVSRQHAELRLGPEGLILTDLGSAAGTFVGGLRLLAHQPQLLPAGAAIRIGPFEITFHHDALGDESVRVTNGVVAATAPVAPLEPPRPTFAPPVPLGPYSRYLHDLPVVYHDGDFLGRYLQIFEAIWEPLEQRQDHIQMYFNPATCPASFLPWLAGWLSIDISEQRQEARQRALLAEAIDLYRWRGTRYGLSRMLELCFDITPQIDEMPGAPLVMRIRMNGERELDRQAVEDVVRAHKPAHVGYVLEWTDTAE